MPIKFWKKTGKLMHAKNEEKILNTDTFTS